MEFNNIELLVYLARKTRLFNIVSTSTTRIAHDLGISQQTVSRKLREMEQYGLIQRGVTYRGHNISLTDKSINLLKGFSESLHELITSKQGSLKGRVVSGVGEGKYYLSLSQYKKRIKEVCGIVPFPGTLNVKVDKQKIRQFLHHIRPLKIEGYTTNERTFGHIICYPVTIQDADAFIVVPERSRYEDVLEIMAPYNLRKKLKLTNNKEVVLRSK